MATRQDDQRNDTCDAGMYSLDSVSGLLVVRDQRLSLGLVSGSTVVHRRVMINISDEDDDLKWTLVLRRKWQLDGEDDEEQNMVVRIFGGVIKVKIPRSSMSHRIVVTVLITSRSLISDDNESFEVRRRLLGVASDTELSGNRMLARADDSKFPVFDLRPRLAADVSLCVEEDWAQRSIFTIQAGEVLPAKNSKIIVCRSYSNPTNFKILQNDEDANDPMVGLFPRTIYCLPFQLDLEDPGKPVSTSLEIQRNGSLSATIEQGRNNRESVFAPQIINVTSPKIATDENEPDLDVKWTRSSSLRTQRAALHIRTTYQNTQINRWRISISKTRSATIHRIFQVPVDGFTQKFLIPSDSLVLGSVAYEIKVEGLQKIDERTLSYSVFKVVCSKSVTTRTPADASDEPSALSSRFQSLALGERRSLGSSRQNSHRLKVPDLKISIERQTFNQATVVIDCDVEETSSDLRWKVIVKKIRTVTGKVPGFSPEKEFNVPATRRHLTYEIPLTFQPGNSYRVTVQADGRPIPCKTAEFRAELTLSDIKELYTIALEEAGYGGNGPCRYLYRNKSHKYFNDIEADHGGIMEIYDKDNSGDQASPINLQIKGLFFMASIERGSNGRPKTLSPFGPRRVLVPAEELLAMAPNLYFVDFYCMRARSTHYVTIVMTEPGSEVDNFCAQRLLPLDIHDQVNNPFLFYDSFGQLNVSTRDNMFVELFFTKNIDITGYEQRNTPIAGKGSSTPGGIPKNFSGQCTLCTLKRAERYPEF